MKCQNIYLVDSTNNQPSKFRTKNRDEVNDDARGIYNTNTPIKFKTTIQKSSSCNYSNTFILVKVTITKQRSRHIETINK